MPEKKSSPTTKSHVIFIILFMSIATIITLFTIYEFLIIGNPFMDPITPNLLWGGIFLVTFSLGFRYFTLKK